MESNSELVSYLKRKGYIETDAVEESFRSVDRKLFVPDEYSDRAYIDSPIPIGRNATISAPHMVEINTELLELEKDSRVLEIGSGSGYQLAIIAEIAGEVIGVEINKELAGRSREKLEKWDNTEIIHGDGLEPVKGKFDRILYSASIERQEWEEAQEYLEEDGILVAPLKENSRQIVKKLKDGEVTEHSRVRFVEKV